jgi:hypothetical protein
MAGQRGIATSFAHQSGPTSTGHLFVRCPQDVRSWAETRAEILHSAFVLEQGPVVSSHDIRDATRHEWDALDAAVGPLKERLHNGGVAAQPLAALNIDTETSKTTSEQG